MAYDPRRSHTKPMLALPCAAASCWSYSLTGIFYLYVPPTLQSGYDTTPMMSGMLFGCLLMLQGCLSYCNDGLVTLGRPLYPGRDFWMICDRICAWTLMVNVFGCVLTWPSAEGDDARKPISLALAATCIVSYPASKTCEYAHCLQSHGLHTATLPCGEDLLRCAHSD